MRSLRNGQLRTMITVPIYGTKLALLVVPDKVLKDVADKFPGPPCPVACGACTVNNADGIAMIFGRELLSHSYVAHEAKHAADFIMERVGCKPCKATREPYAYLQEWIVKWIGRKLRLAGIRTENL